LITPVVEVSVIIPTKNEEKTIGICIEKVKKVFKEYNIDGEIIVSDSSTDRTPEIASSLGAKVIKPDKKGYGYAYIYAFKFARGKYIVIGDGDNTYDFLEIPKLLEPLKKGEADMVIGSRFKGKILPGAMPWLHKYIGNPLLTWILNFFFKAGVSDAHSGFRAFTREALEKMNLRCHGMEFASEMIIEAVRRGLRIKEVPITYYPRHGESKLSSFSDGWRHLRFMLLQTPKYLFYIPGLFLFIVGFILTILLAVTNVSLFGVHLGIHSMIASSLLTLTGYQLIFIGLFSAIYSRSMGLVEYDKITKLITKIMSLERGLLLGIFLTSLGFFYILLLLKQWIDSGFRDLPMLNQDVFGFTIFILGIQTIFFSFFLSLALESLGRIKT
jgi:glycosyltransferase involved in cell wall biosynthesis